MTTEIKRVQDLAAAATIEATDYVVVQRGTGNLERAFVSQLPSASLPDALAAIAPLTPAANKLAYYTGASAAALTDLSAFGRTLIDDADAATARATLGVVIGTDVQAFNANLTAIAGLTSAADKLAYFTGSGTAATADLTSVARTLLAQTTQANMRSVGLGLTAAATATLTSGTWTPTLSFSTPGSSSFSYALQYGYYQRWGDFVYVDFQITFTPTLGTGSGALLISGLPLSAVNSSARDAASGPMGVLSSSFTGFSTTVSVAMSTTSTLRIIWTFVGGASQFTPSNLTNGASHTMNGSISYRVV